MGDQLHPNPSWQTLLCVGHPTAFFCAHQGAVGTGCISQTPQKNLAQVCQSETLSSFLKPLFNMNSVLVKGTGLSAVDRDIFYLSMEFWRSYNNRSLVLLFSRLDIQQANSHEGFQAEASCGAHCVYVCSKPRISLSHPGTPNRLGHQDPQGPSVTSLAQQFLRATNCFQGLDSHQAQTLALQHVLEGCEYIFASHAASHFNT